MKILASGWGDWSWWRLRRRSTGSVWPTARQGHSAVLQRICPLFQRLVVTESIKKPLMIADRNCVFLAAAFLLNQSIRLLLSAGSQDDKKAEEAGWAFCYERMHSFVFAITASRCARCKSLRVIAGSSEHQGLPNEAQNGQRISWSLYHWAGVPAPLTRTAAQLLPCSLQDDAKRVLQLSSA